MYKYPATNGTDMAIPENVGTTRIYSGKVTIRKNIRNRLEIEDGDEVTYEVLSVARATRNDDTASGR